MIATRHCDFLDSVKTFPKLAKASHRIQAYTWKLGSQSDIPLSGTGQSSKTRAIARHPDGPDDKPSSDCRQAESQIACTVSDDAKAANEDMARVKAAAHPSSAHVQSPVTFGTVSVPHSRPNRRAQTPVRHQERDTPPSPSSEASESALLASSSRESRETGNKIALSVPEKQASTGAQTSHPTVPESPEGYPLTDRRPIAQCSRTARDAFQGFKAHHRQLPLV